MACDNTGNSCACTYPGCPRSGNCCKCVAYHRAKSEAPACFFSKSAEKKYDRSLRHLAQDKGLI